MNMRHNTIEKMHNLKLFGMAEEYERQITNPSVEEIPFDQRFRILIDQEATFKDNKRLQLLLKKANFPEQALIENIDYRAQRGVDKSQLLSLTNLEWVQQNINLVMTGPTGTGKTWLACSIGNQACRNGLSVFFVRIPRLMIDLLSARALNQFQKKMQQLEKVDLLILDDWGIEEFSQRGEHDMLELIDARARKRSTIITSQFSMEDWHNTIVNKTVADAVMDRIVHSSHVIKLQGESLRKKVRGKTK